MDTPETPTTPGRRRWVWWAMGIGAVLSLLVIGLVTRYPRAAWTLSLRLRGGHVFTTESLRPPRVGPVSSYPWDVVAEFLNVMDAEPKRIEIGPGMSASAISRTFAEGARFRNIESLWCSSSRVSDDHLRLLTKWPRLAGVSLSNTRITNAGLRSLATCPKLMALALSNTEIDDDGLQILSQMKGLVSLRLDQTRATPAGLARLKSLTDLQVLKVDDTPAMQHALRALEEQLPKLNPDMSPGSF